MKKVRKSLIWASQILLKILLKRLLNWGPKKVRIFQYFFKFSQTFQKRQPLILSPLPVFRKLFCRITFWTWAKFPCENTHKNSTPKSCVNHEKIDVKVMLFFDVTFFRLRSPFEEVLESKMAAKIAVWGPSGHQNAGGQALSRLLKHHDCPKWCLGRAQGRFLSPQASILDGLDSIFSRFGVVFEHVS